MSGLARHQMCLKITKWTLLETPIFPSPKARSHELIKHFKPKTSVDGYVSQTTSRSRWRVDGDNRIEGHPSVCDPRCISHECHPPKTYSSITSNVWAPKMNNSILNQNFVSVVSTGRGINFWISCIHSCGFWRTAGSTAIHQTLRFVPEDVGKLKIMIVYTPIVVTFQY